MAEIPPSGVKRVFAAARNDHEEIIARYIERGGNLNVTDHDGWTLLMHAVVHRRAGIVRFLVDSGADPDTTAEERGTTALAIAQEREYTEIAQILQQAGASR